MAQRRTVATEVEAQGIALHAGVPARLRLLPAPAGTGVVFRRTDLGGAAIPALWSHVVGTALGTAIAEPGGAQAGVVEHLMAALAGAEIDDLVVELDGPEPPILAGDARCYLDLLDRAGTAAGDAPREAVRVLRPVRVAKNGAEAVLVPAERYELYFEIAFDNAAIGRQSFDFVFTPQAFRTEIAPARTFGFVHDLDALLARGLARGASLENTLAIDGERVRNAELIRFPDEFVRHKILDAIGDMKLAGYPLLARFEGRRSGHDLNNALLRALFADPANYAIVQA